MTACAAQTTIPAAPGTPTASAQATASPFTQQRRQAPYKYIELAEPKTVESMSEVLSDPNLHGVRYKYYNAIGEVFPDDSRTLLQVLEGTAERNGSYPVITALIVPTELSDSEVDRLQRLANQATTGAEPTARSTPLPQPGDPS